LPVVRQFLLPCPELDAPDLAGNGLGQVVELDSPHALVRGEVFPGEPQYRQCRLFRRFRAIGQPGEVVRGVRTRLAIRRGPEQRKRLGGNADHVGIEVQQEQPVAFQPRLVAHQSAVRGSPPATVEVSLSLVRRETARWNAVLERHRPHLDERDPRSSMYPISNRSASDGGAPPGTRSSVRIAAFCRAP
jgi:hypothetical protein